MGAGAVTFHIKWPALVNRMARVESVNYEYWRKKPASPGDLCGKCGQQLTEYALARVSFLDQRARADAKIKLCRTCLPLRQERSAAPKPAGVTRTPVVQQPVTEACYDERTGWSVVQDGFLIHENLDYDTASALAEIHRAAPSILPNEALKVLKVKTRGA